MAKQKILIVVSNHPVAKWESEQLKGWDHVLYTPHPIVPPDMTARELDKLVVDFMQESILPCIDLLHIDEYYFCIQGDYGFTFRVQQEILSDLYVDYEKFVFPTTERKVVEVLVNGVVVKNSEFKFVQWR